MRTKLFFLALLLSSMFAGRVSAQRITLPNGQTPFFSGMNVAWRDYANDAADAATNLNDWRTLLDGVKNAGGNTVRWWLFVNASRAPKFDANGYVSGLGSQSINNVKAVLDLAKERNMVIILCLFSFDLLQTGQGGVNGANNKKMLQEKAGIQACVDNCIVPLVKAVGNHPSVLCWEVFNEPEGMADFGWTPTKVGMYDVQRFVNMAAGAIHRAVPGIKVSNGSWNMKVLCNKLGYKNYYSDAELKNAGGDADGYLDFYMVHYYNNDGGDNTQHSPFHHNASYWGLDKPILVAEYAAKGVDNPFLTPQDCYQRVYDNNYAGALSWTYTAHDGLGGLTEATNGMKYLLTNHKADVTIAFAGLIPSAGADQTVFDANFDGSESVILDGSGSSSTSGAITYSWKENGKVISTAAKPVLTVTAGVHTYTLTVSDKVNLDASDVVVVTVKTPNLAYKKPVVASSTEVGVNVPENAVDGDLATRWSSLYTDPQTFMVDLQDVYTINTIDILWESASAKNYTIEVSTDKTTWKTIATQNVVSTVNHTDSIKNLSANARYVRMNGTSRNGTWGYSIFEFEVWGVKPVYPTSITLNKTTTSIEKGMTEKLIATILPANATDQSVQWTSSNTAVATVDANGLITAKTAGQTTITAKTTSGGKIATCTVTVTWNGNYIITTKAGANGIITPSGTFSVAPGASKSFNITPAAHFMVESIKIDGQSVTTASSYTFSNVTADHSIEVTFAPNSNGVEAGLCNPNATPEARSLMSFMREVYGKNILSGQCNEKWLPLIQQKTGEQPAILALDFDGICPSQGGNNGAAKAIDWVKNKGGIVQFQWHWISPNADGDYYSNAFKLGDALANKNGQSFKNMMRDIDLVAGEIKKMQDAGVPFIFRPLHESEGGWFWWGMGTGANLIELYRLMYDRFTNYHKLNNIVWLWNSYGGAKKGNWYPGDDVCDIIGWDYENCDGLNSWDLYSKAFGTKNKLWGLAETGSHPNPNNFAARPWSFFICWDYMIQDPSEPNQDSQGRAGQNSTNWTKTVYADSRTINLGDLGKYNVYGRGAGDANANAGFDQLIFDADMNGLETVTLDGSASTSNSGNAMVYEWRVDGINIATGVKPTLTLKSGVHTIALVMSDGKNNPVGDVVVITVKTPSLAYLKPITASSTEVGDNVVTNANDAKSDTRWSSLYTDPQWISINLQDKYRISSIILQWEDASAKDYVVEFSTDGTTWTDPKSFTGMAAGMRNDTITSIGIVAQYVRITGTARNTKFGYSLYEIEIYGDKANVTQNIALQKGWNLISINVSPANNSIANLFKNIDVAEIKDLNTFWRKGQADAFNSLQTITTGSGYLVNMNAAATLSIVGTASNLIIENPGGTTTGWQLIGCPYQIDTPLSQVFDATNCSVIKNFEGFWIPSIGAITSLKNLEVGKGYFIKK